MQIVDDDDPELSTVSMKFDLHFYAPSLQNFRKHFVPISELQLIPFTLVIGRTLFYRTLNEIEFHSLNIEQT